MVTKTFLSNETIDEMTKTLAEKCSSFAKGCTKIIGIARGGIPIAERLAVHFDLPYDSVYISWYDGQVKREKPVIDLPSLENLQGSQILIVDDLVDTGSTVTTLQKYLDQTSLVYKTAVLFRKPTSSVNPDFWVEETGDWIVFPWEQE